MEILGSRGKEFEVYPVGYREILEGFQQRVM
jgi:hypothetical protein